MIVVVEVPSYFQKREGVDFYDKISDPEIRDFFPQGFFSEATEDDFDLLRNPQPVNWYQYPFRSVHVPAMLVRNPAVERRRQWARRYWQSLERRKKRERKWQEQPKRDDTLHHRWDAYSVPVIQIRPPVPHMDGEPCQRCGKTFYHHKNGERWLRVQHHKLAQIEAAMKLRGYKELSTGYYVLLSGDAERTVKFFNCTWESGGAWITYSARWVKSQKH